MITMLETERRGNNVRQFARVAVLGFGDRGVAIALAAAASGATVTVVDLDDDLVAGGLRQVTSVLEGRISDATLTTRERDEIVGRIRASSAVSAIADAELVIEVVVEDLEIKRSVLADVEAVVGADTVIVTGTSVFAVTEVARTAIEPSRFAGLHFPDTALAVAVVEVVVAAQTGPSIVEKLADFARAIGVEPLVVKDRPGFLINRLLAPYLNDVIQAHDDQLATPDDIDLAIKLGLGYKIGPLEMLDRIGLDSHLIVTTAIYEATRDSSYAPPPLLQNMVASGQLGVTSGNGFRSNQEQA